jgi:hypothetical protein
MRQNLGGTAGESIGPTPRACKTGVSAVLPLRVVIDSEVRVAGQVAEWQTRWLQVSVSERMWGFKSPLAHHSLGFFPEILRG